MRQLDVAIIGAGSAGLTARREVEKVTKNYLVFDDGPLGTTCARVGCMPSKVLIQVANDYHRRLTMGDLGISGAENLMVDSKKVMDHVRGLRDRFTGGVKKGMDDWQKEHLVRERVEFVDRDIIKAGGETYKANKVIIAAGSRPIIPKPWMEVRDKLITTDEIFEMDEIPNSMAVIGLGVIGLELGQAFSRLGSNVIGIGLGRSMGGATDPEIQDYIIKTISSEMEISLEGVDKIEREGDQLRIFSKDKSWLVDKALVAIGRRPNIDRMSIEAAGVELNDRGLPRFDLNTARIESSNYFIAGDINGDRPLLHEAADEGRIAGYNAVNGDQCFLRRTPLGITFSDPNIATVGKTHQAILNEDIPFVTGTVSFEGQGRALSMVKAKGLLKVYAHKTSGHILGAEMMAPSGEHLAHLISWAISWQRTVQEVLSLPFYHPVVEEGLRTAFREAAKQLESHPSPLEILRCQDDPVSGLAVADTN